MRGLESLVIVTQDDFNSSGQPDRQVVHHREQAGEDRDEDDLDGGDNHRGADHRGKAQQAHEVEGVR